MPLMSMLVAVFLPINLSYLIPMAQNRQKTAMDFYSLYSAEDMRKARNTAWKYFVTEPKSKGGSEKGKRLDDYLCFLTQPESSEAVTPEMHEIYQETSRVLEYFAMINACLERRAVDRDMVRSFIGWYYSWWRDEVMNSLRDRPFMLGEPARYRPVWWNKLKELDELCDETAQPDGAANGSQRGSLTNKTPNSTIHTSQPPIPESH